MSEKKLREDANESAFRVLQEATGEKPKTAPPGKREEPNPIAVERGRRGGEKDGKVRAERLTEERRQEIARKASRTRWGKKE